MQALCSVLNLVIWLEQLFLVYEHGVLASVVWAQRWIFPLLFRTEHDLSPLGYLQRCATIHQESENIVIAKSITKLPIYRGSISDQIKPFGVDLVIWIFRRLEKDDVNSFLLPRRVEHPVANSLRPE